MIKHAINNETKTEYKVLISLTRMSESQMTMINKIIAHFDALVANDSENKIDADTRKRYEARLYKRVEIFHASVAVDTNRKCAVYYVTKNNALKNAAHLYDLKRCKLATSKNDSATSKKEDSAKRETKSIAKREKSVKRETKQVTATSDSDSAIKLLESATNEVTQ